MSNDLTEICLELTSLAEQEQQRIEQFLPNDPISAFVLFTEMVRVTDYLNAIDSMNQSIPRTHRDIMDMGWNSAVACLLRPIEMQGFPFSKSTTESRSQAVTILFRLGIPVLVRRLVEMIKSGLILVEKEEKAFLFKRSVHANSQHLDQLDFDSLWYLEGRLQDLGSDNEQFNQWRLVELEAIAAKLHLPGSFWSKGIDLKKFIIGEIDLQMRPLIRQWDFGHGKMIGYETTPEIDAHFFVKALELVLEWRDDAGLHPDVPITDQINASDLIGIVTLLVSFHLKHVHFTLLGASYIPELTIAESLSIWKPLDEVVISIAEFTGMPISRVRSIFDMIVVKEGDRDFIKNYTTKLTPLLVNMENGFCLYPVSSVMRNPFFTILPLLEHRTPKIKYDISKPRESWLRASLYSLFQGLRYQTVDGNIKLSNGNKVVTDIDAAVLDHATGELALFQIKWQDFFHNDVRALRSKSKNLVNELDDWAERVNDWILNNSTERLCQSLRLKMTNEKPLAVCLFGISRNVAHPKGYGYKTTANNLAIANWAQFVRNRFEVGPAEKVFSEIFGRLRKEAERTIESKPMPVEFETSGVKMKLIDFWVAVNDEVQA